MDDNIALAGEMLRVARSLVAWKPYPVDYRMQDAQRRENAMGRISQYVSDLEAMAKMLEGDGDVCRGKMIEVLKEFEAYVDGNL